MCSKSEKQNKSLIVSSHEYFDQQQVNASASVEEAGVFSKVTSLCIYPSTLQDWNTQKVPIIQVLSIGFQPAFCQAQLKQVSLTEPNLALIPIYPPPGKV